MTNNVMDTAAAYVAAAMEYGMSHKTAANILRATRMMVKLVPEFKEHARRKAAKNKAKGRFTYNGAAMLHDAAFQRRVGDYQHARDLIQVAKLARPELP